MSLAIALLIVAQSASPVVAETSLPSITRTARPVAVRTRASARVLRPARIEISYTPQTSEQRAQSEFKGIQRARDGAGTLWVEFN